MDVGLFYSSQLHVSTADMDIFTLARTRIQLQLLCFGINRQLKISYRGKGKGKVFPLQARCGPEGG